jgi:hypothetical protein
MLNMSTRSSPPIRSVNLELLEDRIVDVEEAGPLMVLLRVRLPKVHRRSWDRRFQRA